MRNKLLSRLFKDVVNVESAELQDNAEEAGALTIANLKPGDFGVVHGLINYVSLNPTNLSKQFEIEVFDGTDRMHAIFMGRSNLPGVEPGMTIEIEGRVVEKDHFKTIFNPKYRIIKDHK